MQRRSFLKRGSLVATVGLVGVAGCGSPEGNGGGGGTSPTGGTETGGGMSTATETDAGIGGTETTQAETQTQTETAAETQTDTAEGTGTQTGTTGGGASGTNTVEMVTDGRNFYFDPIGLYVESGTTVTWSNASGSHSSTAYAEGNGPATVTRIPESAEPWDSGNLEEQGATFEYTFETPGTYDYFCREYKSLQMVGRIVVDEPGGPAEGSMPPDGEVPESQTIVDQGSVAFGDFSP